MSNNRKNYQNLLENKNHLTVQSHAHNTIESLENQIQDAFSVERSPPQFYMQRMGQLQIYSQGRGRYKLDKYQTLDNLSFPGQMKVFNTEFEQKESFVILPKRKQKYMIQIPSFFRLYPKVKKIEVKPEQNESLLFPKTIKKYELKNENNFLIERKKRVENLIESINDIKLQAEGKFFFNRPTLQKKSNLEIEYLVIKAPLRSENATNLTLEQLPKKNRYDEIREENIFNINYNMIRYKGFHPEKLSQGETTNFILPRKIKSYHYKTETMRSESSSNIELKRAPRQKSSDLVMENLPDVFIQENPAKRYVSVGMEGLTFIGNVKPEYCLEVDPNEEIFVPNVYDMLLIQNFWDNLEIEDFRICFRPFGYKSNKNLTKDSIGENKENINKNLENENNSLSIGKEEDKKEGEKNDDDILKRQESKEEEGKSKKKLKFRDLKIFPGKK